MVVLCYMSGLRSLVIILSALVHFIWDGSNSLHANSLHDKSGLIYGCIWSRVGRLSFYLQLEPPSSLCISVVSALQAPGNVA